LFNLSFLSDFPGYLAQFISDVSVLSILKIERYNSNTMGSNREIPDFGIGNCLIARCELATGTGHNR